MKKSEITLQEIKVRVKQFIKERDWEQFHSPKNISMSISIEAAELMEHFQWLTIEQSKKLLNNKKKREEIEDELADIAIYIVDFCNLFHIDIGRSILRKLDKSAKKYPAHIVKGKIHKYTYYRKLRK